LLDKRRNRNHLICGRTPRLLVNIDHFQVVTAGELGLA
jgi:hypothetical protein